MRIVPAFNELKDRQACFCLGVEGLTVEQFALESGKEALAQGVIVAIADRAHRRTDAGFPAALAEGQRGVLTALIGVVNDAFGTALLNSHVQGIHHQGGLEVSGHCPTDDFATPGIHDNG